MVDTKALNMNLPSPVPVLFIELPFAGSSINLPKLSYLLISINDNSKEFRLIKAIFSSPLYNGSNISLPSPQRKGNECYGRSRLWLYQNKLAKLIVEKGISKNKPAHRAEMQRTQINQYCNNEVTRLDTAVLARICTALDCRIEELLEFVPAKDKELP